MPIRYHAQVPAKVQRSRAERNSGRKVMVDGFSRIHQRLINRDDVRYLQNFTTVTIRMFEIEINVFVKTIDTYLLRSSGLEIDIVAEIYLFIVRSMLTLSRRRRKIYFE